MVSVSCGVPPGRRAATFCDPGGCRCVQTRPVGLVVLITCSASRVGNRPAGPFGNTEDIVAGVGVEGRLFGPDQLERSRRKISRLLIARIRPTVTPSPYAPVPKRN